MGNLCAGLVFGGGDTFLGWKEESPGYLQRGQDLAETFAQLPVPGLKRSHTSWGGGGGDTAFQPGDCFCFGLFCAPDFLENILEKGGKKRRLSQRTETARESLVGAGCCKQHNLSPPFVDLAYHPSVGTATARNHPLPVPSEGRERGTVTLLTLPALRPL